MNLTLDLRRKLHEALLQAFPSYKDLEKLCAFGLDTPLATIASAGGSTSDAALDMITWASAHDKVIELVTAASRENPDNLALKNINHEVVIVGRVPRVCDNLILGNHVALVDQDGLKGTALLRSIKDFLMGHYKWDEKHIIWINPIGWRTDEPSKIQREIVRQRTGQKAGDWRPFIGSGEDRVRLLILDDAGALAEHRMIRRWLRGISDDCTLAVACLRPPKDMFPPESPHFSPFAGIFGAIEYL